MYVIKVFGSAYVRSVLVKPDGVIECELVAEADEALVIDDAIQAVSLAYFLGTLDDNAEFVVEVVS